MTEEELIEEGFERIDVPVEESGDETDYHYYRYSFGSGYGLYSSESNNTLNNKWTVSFDECINNITDIEDIQVLIALFKKWKVI